jgi:hypothetical protein
MLGDASPPIWSVLYGIEEAGLVSVGFALVSDGLLGV